MGVMLDQHGAAGHLDGSAIDEEFLALMCSDEEWLRAEFDAIIASEWGTPPRRRRPDEDVSRTKGRRDRPVQNGTRWDRVLRSESLTPDWQARGRSPPRDWQRARQRPAPRWRGCSTDLGAGGPLTRPRRHSDGTGG